MSIKPMQELRDRFAHNLRATREKKGISQQGLALLCGINRTEISLFERGKRSPRLDMIIHLGNALEVSPAELLDGME